MEIKIKAVILAPIAIAASALATDKTVSPGAMYFEKYMMFVSYALCGALLLLTIFAGQMHQEVLFVCAAILAIFFWASLFSLFPITVGTTSARQRLAAIMACSMQSPRAPAAFSDSFPIFTSKLRPRQ